jgi:hypothetical protein
MKNIILALCVLLGVQACNQNKKEQDQLFKEVMTIHDEVMPEMGTLRRLSKGIELQLDSLEASSADVDDQKKQKMEAAAKKLDKANESMMAWMRQFEQIEEGTPHEEVLEYLKRQKQLIEEVRDNMLTAKKEGEQFKKGQ